MKNIPEVKPCEKCGTNWWDIGCIEYINGKWVKFMICTKCGNKVYYENCDD